VFVDPAVKVSLQLVNRLVDLVAKGHPVQLASTALWKRSQMPLSGMMTPVPLRPAEPN
jgi:hypothetical protein